MPVFSYLDNLERIIPCGLITIFRSCLVPNSIGLNYASFIPLNGDAIWGAQGENLGATPVKFGEPLEVGNAEPSPARGRCRACTAGSVAYNPCAG